MTQTDIHLIPAQFTECERSLATFRSLSATAFRYSSGVCGLRLRNGQGSLVILPYQGQQIWSASFGRDITMRSMFAEPRRTRDFLANFGGFLQHCGLSGVGEPSAKDRHPIHGELHNAPYQKATLVTGQDERGFYIGVGGSYQHTIAFGPNYLAEPLVKLYAGQTICHVSMTITNLKRSPMEFCYLAHVNFRPVDDGRLVYSAPRSPQHVRVRATIPSHIHPAPGYKEFIQQLQADPFQHECLNPALPFDPEVVFFIDYMADDQGWAHTMQVHPDGTADYLRHRPAQLPRATRWICRTPDQDAIAIAEVGTCEPEGYHAEKAKGNVRTLAAGQKFKADFEVGVVGAEKARQIEENIKK